jgi:hypothetical protein
MNKCFNEILCFFFLHNKISTVWKMISITSNFFFRNKDCYSKLFSIRTVQRTVQMYVDMKFNKIQKSMKNTIVL